MGIRTGTTFVENILSLDADNNPVSGATFDVTAVKSGVVYTGLTVSMSLVDANLGVFSASWSASSIGDYQFYIKNNITNVIYLTDVVSVLSDADFDQNIYIGL